MREGGRKFSQSLIDVPDLGLDDWSLLHADDEDGIVVGENARAAAVSPIKIGDYVDWSSKMRPPQSTSQHQCLCQVYYRRAKFMMGSPWA